MIAVRATEYEPWMKRALSIAHKRYDPDTSDPPVAAVLYDADNHEIAAAHHNCDHTGDPTAHAEMTVLRRAGRRLGTWRLHGCTLVTTLEPCTMCAGALVLARLPTLAIGSWDPKHGAICSLWDVVRDRRLNHYVEVIPEVLQTECDALLQLPRECQRSCG